MRFKEFISEDAKYEKYGAKAKIINAHFSQKLNGTFKIDDKGRIICNDGLATWIQLAKNAYSINVEIASQVADNNLVSYAFLNQRVIGAYDESADEASVNGWLKDPLKRKNSRYDPRKDCKDPNA